MSVTSDLFELGYSILKVLKPNDWLQSRETEVELVCANNTD